MLCMKSEMECIAMYKIMSIKSNISWKYELMKMWTHKFAISLHIRTLKILTHEI